MTDENETYQTVPTTQTDLKARREADYKAAAAKADPNATNAPYAVEGNDTSAYVGVDSDRMTYANDTEKPLTGDGVEDEVARELMSGYAYGEVKPDDTPGQTTGAGSSVPVLAVTSSGSAVEHKLTGGNAPKQSTKSSEDEPRKSSDDKSDAPKKSQPKPPAADNK